MSAYLSPIQSSGDSTPIESLVSSQSCIPLVEDERNQIENEFPVREFKQTTNKRQASKTIDSNRQKASTTSTTANKKPRLIVDHTNNSTLIATTSSDEEELEDSSGAADEDELRGDESRFASSQESYSNKRHKIGRGHQQRAGQEGNEQYPATKSTTNHNNQHSRRPHQCLADQFLSMISVAAKPDNHQQGHETRSSSCVSSESDLLNGNESNGFNHHDHDHKLRRLLTRAATRQQKLRKRFKQILQSIPVVQLVATTSIMTIIILLSLLLLGDSQHFVTALRSQQRATPGELEGRQGDEQQQQQQQHDSSLETSGSNIDQRQLNALPQMQSLVMGSRIGQQPEAGQRNSLAQLANSVLADESPKLDETPPTQQRRPVVNLRRELIGQLFTQRQHQRHHNSHQHHNPHNRQAIDPERGHAPEKRQLGAARPVSDEQLNLAGEPQQQQQAGLFDSLGAMLFGAANQQEQPQRVADELGRLAASQAEVEGDRAAFERDSSGDGDQEEGLQAAGFVLDGAPHVSPVMAVSPRPAHLHSSALVLSPHNNPGRHQSKQHLAARQTGSHPRQQHVASGGATPPHHNQNGPQVDRLQQLQQAPPTESTMADNRHERKFDVPQIQCNNTDEGFERFACPTPDNLGRYRCIEDVLVCDGYFDCPNGEDEDRTSCMYYRLFISHIDILTNTFLTWMKSQTRQAANDISSNQNANNQHNHRQQSLHLVGGELED